MRFLVCIKNRYNGISYHRLVKPFEYLEKAIGAKVTFFDTLENLGEFTPEDYDYLVFNRSIGHGLKDAQIIHEFKKFGMKLILDIDDYWELPEYHTIRNRPDVNYDEWQACIKNNLLLADYIWTTNQFLKTKIEQEGVKCPIAIARNAIDYRDKQWSTTEKRMIAKNKVVIGYAGSTTHYRDLDELADPIYRIHRTKWLDQNLHWCLFGLDLKSGDWSRAVWQHQYNIFSSNNRYGRNVSAYPGRPVVEYAHFYDQMDISIAAVIDNDFNRAKSELKILEAGAKRLPFIGSDVMTYNRTSANVDLCSSSDDWVEAIKELAGDKQLRKELGDELYDYVRENYVIGIENESRLSILL